MKKIITLLTILTLAFALPCFATEATTPENTTTPNTVTINFDVINEVYTFTAEDFTTAFGTLDAFEASDLSRVVIVTLPQETAGSLTLNGEPITTLPKGIDISEIGGLQFTPASGFTGEATFTWRGKTADTSDNTIFTTKIVVANEYADTTVNVTAYKNETYTFKNTDFTDAFNTLEIGNIARAVIVSLPDPAAGVLQYNEQDVASLPYGFAIEDVSKLTFVPAEDYTGFTTFTWRGKTTETNSDVIFTTKVRVIQRPAMQALDKELTTDKNVTLISQLEANYAEGASFVIVSQPQHGTVSNLNTQTGEFQYTPAQDYVGQDTFTFKAVMGEGDAAVSSNVATVTITIQQTEEVIPFYYVDMQSSWANYSASHLADMGIMVGENYNGDYFFKPNTVVKRSEFVIAMLSVLNIAADDSTETTFRFADDSDIADWLKPYAYTAYAEGIIKGSLENGKLYFNGDNNITRAEAATIINNSIDLLVNNTDELEFTDAADIPEWSLGAIKNMVGYEIITGYEDNTFKASTSITRAELAEMLYKAIKEKQNQADSEITDPEEK